MGWRKRPWMAVLDHPDQQRVRTELTLFFSPRPEAYLACYDRVVAQPRDRRFRVFTWSWPGLILGPAWMLYRKMPLSGAFFLFFPLVFTLAVSEWAMALSLLVAPLGKPLYLQAALRRIHAADILGLSGQERDEYLSRAGGVSGVVLAMVVVWLVAYTAMDVGLRLMKQRGVIP